jgi:hypothetical protein
MWTVGFISDAAIAEVKASTDRFVNFPLAILGLPTRRPAISGAENTAKARFGYRK